MTLYGDAAALLCSLFPFLKECLNFDREATSLRNIEPCLNRIIHFASLQEYWVSFKPRQNTNLMENRIKQYCKRIEINMIASPRGKKHIAKNLNTTEEQKTYRIVSVISPPQSSKTVYSFVFLSFLFPEGFFWQALGQWANELRKLHKADTHTHTCL